MTPAPTVTTIDHIELDASSDAAPGQENAFREAFDVSRVTTSPGCYLMRGDAEKVLYVGKAKNLRARIRSYLNESDERYSVKFLMRRVRSIDFLVTSSEKEALLLENSLIKQYKPRYNVQMRDDKMYVSLRFNTKEDYPRITVVRRFRKDGAKYFGPYSSAGAVRETLRHIQRIFPLRTCADSVLNNRTRPCLYYQMKQCVAPCVNLCSRDQYHEIVDQVVMALEGRSDELEKLLVRRIEDHAAKLEFEAAAEVRDRLFSIRKTLERQRTVGNADDDRDVIGVHVQDRFAELQIIFYRGGKLLGGRSFSFKQLEMPLEEVLGSFLLQYYGEAPVVPPEILIPVALEESETLAEILTEHRGAKVVVHFPQRGDKRAMVELAIKNAKNNFEEKRLTEQAHADLLQQMKEKLSLARIPNRIECFDIATTQGTKPVGSMVVFEGGVANKQRYRHFSIKSVEGQDDFAMMREMLLRRYTRAIQEGDLPDLVLVDGGKGQLGVAVAVLSDLGIEDLPTVGIAKSRALDGGGHSPERFFIPGRMNPIILPQNSPIVHLMARVRDEAHRFANTHHAKRRSKGTIRTALVDIPGVGPTRAKALLNAFGSLAKIAQGSVDKIAEVKGVTRPIAERIKATLAGSPAETSQRSEE